MPPQPSSSPSTVSIRVPPAKRLRVPAELPPDLGKYIERDVKLLRRLGWQKFVQHRRQRGDIGNLQFHHPAMHTLHQYKHHGVPVRLSTPPWSKQRLQQALHRGAHRSCFDYIDFLETEFVEMIRKSQWVVLPYDEVKHLPYLRVSPPGVIPQRDRRPRWIVDYSYSSVNDETQPIVHREAMQFGYALDRILREILLADPANGTVYLLKLDISDGFYRVGLAPTDIPKLGVVFPTTDPSKPLVALPLVLPMGWSNSPPAFSTATETAADMANQLLHQQSHVPPEHPLNSLAAQLDTLHPVPDSSISSSSLPAPLQRDPSLPTHHPSSTPASYVDVFVDDFIALCQGTSNLSRTRNILLQAVNTIFRPLDYYDSIYRKDPVSIKKLHKGDCSWATIKNCLGWIINTQANTITLPEHRRVADLASILADIPSTQKRISKKRWWSILGKFRSVSLALPGSRGLFSFMQHALTHSNMNHRIALRKDVHNALNDFRWLLQDITNRPTRIAEVVPLRASALGYHDASGSGAGGVWFPASSLCSRHGTSPGQPLVWRYNWPSSITNNLVSYTNPHGTITNSDLELAGGLLHLQALAQCYDIRERTVLSKTDNLATLYWQRKGAATTDKAPAHLLRFFGLHQRFHRYVPRHDYIAGPSNPLADFASRSAHLTSHAFLASLNSLYPKLQPYKLVHLPQSIISSVTSALHKKRSNVESLLVAPPAPTPTGPAGSTTPLTWASTPFSKPSKTKYLSYRSSSTEFDMAHTHEEGIQSALDRLKTTYGRLHRRSSQWGPLTHG